MCTYVAEQVNFERMYRSWLFADNCRGMRVSDVAAIVDLRAMKSLLLQTCQATAPARLRLNDIDP